MVPDLNTGIKEGLTGVATGSMTPEQGAAAMQAGMDKAAAAG